jgi:DNA/RNA endonuclease YhcR with UshA esterase domain
MQKRHWLLAIGFVLSALLALSAQTALARDLTITLQPGQTARVAMKFWCLDFGKPFPKQVTGPTARAPDAVVRVLQTALTKGTLTSDPYQTQLAIWKAADGTFHDVAAEGHVLADQIVSESASAAVTPLPAGVGTLDAAVTQGTVKTTIENFTAITDTQHNQGQPFVGTGELVIQNVSGQPVTFVLVEGAVFKPASGVGQTTAATNEQTLLSHQDTSRPSTLPTTGQPVATPETASLLLLLGGLLMLLAARWLKVSARR